MHHPPPYCTLIQCLFSINMQQVLMSMGVIFFSVRMNSVTLCCFIRTSTSDIVPSDCPSAAICHTATKRSGILVGRFNLYCLPPTSASDTVGWHNKIRGITFGEAVINLLHTYSLRWVFLKNDHKRRGVLRRHHHPAMQLVNKQWKEINSTDKQWPDNPQMITRSSGVANRKKEEKNVYPHSGWKRNTK